MTFLLKETILFLTGFMIIICPYISFAELPEASDRPFWTQKTCYRMDNLIYGVGLSTGNHSLEEARKKSFKAALWEISNYAQIKDTTLLIVETQMTYEEQNKNGTFSVWRLVRVPLPMIEKTRALIVKSAPSYKKTVKKIKNFEKEDREDLADELRRALLDNKAVQKSDKKRYDKKMPTGTIRNFRSSYSTDESISLVIRAEDNLKLATVLFSVQHSGIRKKWNLDKKTFARKISFPASDFKPGRHIYDIRITDAAGNVSLKRGVFNIENIHKELYDILTKDCE